MKKSIFTGLFLAAFAGVSAQAATIFTLNQDGCTGGCLTGSNDPIVSLVQNGTGASATVTVTETLGPNENYAGTGAGDALDFNIAGAISITGITTGFTVNTVTPFTASAFGTFLDSVTCTACMGSTGPTGPLSFTVSSATGVTIASFIGNPTYFFASDIASTINGVTNTGNVASLGGSGQPTPDAPEPATMVLTGSALIGAAVLTRRRRKA